MASPDELVRVVRGPDGELRLGTREPGRGAWLCRATPSCVEQAARREAFGRAFKVPITAAAVRRLQEELDRGARQGGSTPQVCEDGAAGRLAGPRPQEEGS